MLWMTISGIPFVAQQYFNLLQWSNLQGVVVAIFDFLGDNYTQMMVAFDSTDEAWDLGCFGIHQLFLNNFSDPLSCT